MSQREELKRKEEELETSLLDYKDLFVTMSSFKNYSLFKNAEDYKYTIDKVIKEARPDMKDFLYKGLKSVPDYTKFSRIHRNILNTKMSEEELQDLQPKKKKNSFNQINLQKRKIEPVDSFLGHKKKKKV